MSDTSDDADHPRAEPRDANALIPRLRVIEEQPLGDRAVQYARVHDELRRALESNDDAAGPA